MIRHTREHDKKAGRKTFVGSKAALKKIELIEQIN